MEPYFGAKPTTIFFYDSERHLGNLKFVLAEQMSEFEMKTNAHFERRTVVMNIRASTRPKHPSHSTP